MTAWILKTLKRVSEWLFTDKKFREWCKKDDELSKQWFDNYDNGNLDACRRIQKEMKAALMEWKGETIQPNTGLTEEKE